MSKDSQGASRITLKVDSEFKKEVQIRAIKENTTLTDYVLSALHQKMNIDTSKELSDKIEQRLNQIEKGLAGETVESIFSEEELKGIDKFVEEIRGSSGNK